MTTPSTPEDETARVRLRAEELQDILTAPPPWFTRWGVTALVLAAALLLGLSAVVRYPDVVPGRVVVVSARPPVAVVARTDGRVVRLMAREGDRVSAGDRLAVIESSASADDLFRLEAWLQQTESSAPEDGLPSELRTLPPPLRLGDLQAEHALLSQLVDERRAVMSDDTHARRIEAFRVQIAAHERLAGSLDEQHRLKRRASSLAEEDAAGDRPLVERGYLAPSLARENARRLLAEELAIQDIAANRWRNDVVVAEYRRRILELEQERRERLRGLSRAIRESLQRLRKGLAVWEYQFVLRAPTAGRVTFFDVWTGDQLVRAGKESMYVVPDGQAWLGRMQVVQQGVGRARPGQTVKVRLDGYPAHQYGLIDARVDSISGTARQDEYAVSLSFPAGLRTSHGRQLPPRQGMTGQAEIITEHRRLLGRLFAPLRFLVERAAGGDDK